MKYPPPDRKRYRWWQWSALLRAKVQCQHLHADRIYGDEINDVGGSRGYCWECRTYLDALPYGFNGPNSDLRIRVVGHDIGGQTS